MKQKAWIDVKGPRIFYLEGYTIYWGNRIWSEILDTSNLSQMSLIADTCYENVEIRGPKYL